MSGVMFALGFLAGALCALGVGMFIGAAIVREREEKR